MNLSELFSGEAPVWVSGQTYTVGQVVRDPMDWYFRYVRVAGGAGTTNPINDPSNWRPDGGRAIKSVQRGTIVITGGGYGAATVSAVNTAKAELRFHGGVGYNSSGNVLIPSIVLTNSTTITAYAGGLVAGGMHAGWELTEHY